MHLDNLHIFLAYLLTLKSVVERKLNLLYAFIKKRKAEQNPWGEGATKLEWSVTSPPPIHTFEELPKIK